MKKRLDQLIVDLGLAPSRTKAKDLIEAGSVRVLIRAKLDFVPAQGELKPSLLLDPDTTKVEITDSEILKYVSRGGLKLEGALKELNLSLVGKRVLDLGISTGGFTDCALQHGAMEVFGVDVGTEETHEKIKNDHRVKLVLGKNVKDLDLMLHLGGRPFDLVLADLSFISLSKVLGKIFEATAERGAALLLVKPQFEVGAGHLDKKGIVKDPAARQAVVEAVVNSAKQVGFTRARTLESIITGKDGNQEYFLYAEK